MGDNPEHMQLGGSLKEDLIDAFFALCPMRSSREEIVSLLPWVLLLAGIQKQGYLLAIDLSWSSKLARLRWRGDIAYDGRRHAASCHVSRGAKPRVDALGVGYAGDVGAALTLDE
ncbi:jg511 [Pararge aegeria aegeria]|uniref:Jg511 protein n=1 Tax=Pararge aegeria aegeria TaxID=348720 RepID=A0A8S4QLS7_9NEOP|nr:jg511 [Pararge aegeria aegeria]